MVFKLVVTVLKLKIIKNRPIEINYRDYKKFDQIKFYEDLDKFSSSNAQSYTEFENNFLHSLNKHAPFKKKIIRANNKPYMTKKLRKAIMKRSQLEKYFHKKPTDKTRMAYKKQKNYVSRLYKKERKSFYGNLNLSILSDNKLF